MTDQLLLGQTLSFSGDPFQTDWRDVSHHDADGAVLVRDGQIVSVGSRDQMRADNPQAQIHDYAQDLIVAGFVDAHVHYPQTAIINSWGKRLIDWLNTYTFPEEMRLSDPAYADEIAGRYMDLALAHGTTTMASYCTSAPASVDAYFGAAAARGMCVVGGKTCMDRNAPDGLTDTAQRAYDESRDLIGRWHGNGRGIYAITPRFSPTSTAEQLQALGDLWAEHPDYLDTYEQFGLLGAKGVFGHSIHLKDREIARLAEVGGAVVHCPTSNTFIGSGLFDVMGLAKAKVTTGLATDIGGGSNFSMLHTMAAAYEIGQLRGDAIHPAQLMWLASEGSAKALHMAGQIGHLGTGAAADICVIDMASKPAIEQRVNNANDFWEALFPTIMMGDDRAIRQVWVAGQPV